MRALAVFDDGSGPALYAGGDFDSAGAIAAGNIARWDGTTWSALGAPGSGVNGAVRSFLVFDDGSGEALYAGGGFSQAGGVAAASVAKWNGSSWSPLGGGVDGGISCMTVFDDGNGPALYVGGVFLSAGGTAARNIARWDGTSWSVVGNAVAGGGEVAALASFDDGSGPALFAGGWFTSIGGVNAAHLAKWNGTSWSPVGAGFNGANSVVKSIASFDDGTGSALYIGGAFNSAGGVAASRIAKWNGANWSAVGGGVNSTVNCLTIFDDGSGPALFLGGALYTAGGMPAAHVVRWDGTSWAALGSGVNLDVTSLIPFDDGSGTALFAGGHFTSAGPVGARSIAKWDAPTWSGLGPTGEGVDNYVRTLAVFDEGSGPMLFAGGDFTTAGGVPAQRVARWSGTNWSALGAPGDGMNSSVFDLVSFDDSGGPALYAAGDFTSAGGSAAQNVAKWDGTSWTELGPPGSGTDGLVLELDVFDDGTGSELYAVGLFNSAGGVPAPNIAKWNGTSWSALGAPGSGLDNSAGCLAVFDDGSGPALFVGGSFSSAGGVSASRIAKWDGTSWTPLGAPGSGANNVVICLAVFDDGSGPALFAGGAFSSIGGVSAVRVAKWDGTSWSALGAPGDGMNSLVRELVTFDDGFGPALYAVGDFTTAGGVDAKRIAKWNGSTWSALGPSGAGMNSSALCLAVFDDGMDGDPDLFAGGLFTATDTVASSRIAQWHGCANDPAPFCFGDGSSGACPCGNIGQSGKGCENSAGTGGAVLTATGMTSPDTLVLTSSGELATAFSVFLQGTSELVAGAVFGDGVRCVGGNLKRLYIKSAIGGMVSAPTGGDPMISVQSSNLGDPIAPGSTRYYQVYYRDPSLAFCPDPPGSSFNVSSGLRVTW